MRNHDQSTDCSSLAEIDFTRRNVYWTGFTHGIQRVTQLASVKFHDGWSANEIRVTYFIAYISPDIFQAHVIRYQTNNLHLYVLYTPSSDLQH